MLGGLFQLANRLFGVTIVAADGEAPVWHPDVRFFKVQIMMTFNDISKLYQHHNHVFTETYTDTIL